MFSKTLFKGDLSDWNVSSGEMFSSMFEASIFNSDLSKWKMHNAYNIAKMFKDAVFKQDVAAWVLSSPYHASNMFKNNTEGLHTQSMSDWIIGYYAGNGVLHPDPTWQAAFKTYAATKALLALDPANRGIDLRSLYASTAEEYTVDGDVFEATL